MTDLAAGNFNLIEELSIVRKELEVSHTRLRVVVATGIQRTRTNQSQRKHSSISSAMQRHASIPHSLPALPCHAMPTPILSSRPKDSAPNYALPLLHFAFRNTAYLPHAEPCI